MVVHAELGAAALCALICRVTALGNHNQGLPTMGWCDPHAEMGWEKGGFSQLLEDAMSGCSGLTFSQDLASFWGLFV